MHQIGSGMYVSGPVPDRRRERRLSSGSAATPPYTGGDVTRSGELGRMFDIAASQSQAPSPASSSRRSSGPLPRPSPSPASGPLSQLSHQPGLLVGPSPAPSPARGSSRKGSSRRSGGGGRKEMAGETGGAAVAACGTARLGVPFACYVLVAVAAMAAIGAGVFCVVSWRRWEVLAAAGGAVAAVAAVFASNAWRRGGEAERYFRRFPDTVFDGHGDMPVGEIVKITGQVTCGRHPLGAYFHDAARCVFTSVQLFERRGWARGCCCRRWQLRHSEARVANFYISDRNSGKRFYVRAGEGAKITPMIKLKTINFDGDRKGTSLNLKNWMANNDLSSNGAMCAKEGFIREGDTASVIGVLKKHHACDIVDVPPGVVTTGCQPMRFMFPILMEGLILIGNEDPDEAVYMV
ncbi:hypothetical protein HU200_058947 [Digitaria exilis]|uniref:Uncharacterized protein n=1 Tax=Digitaria exilis TaxID=1010633 RepID=A0A835ACM6_9POAL|nr:hypothetical protein HU200_058947 [Digitaria exilis]CAB3468499.1 unnamed protein product [Digitaria exilis]